MSAPRPPARAARRNTSTRYQRPYRPLPLAAANGLLRRLEQAGWRPPPLEPDALIRAARRHTGLNELGDPLYREPLARLLRSVNAEARLHPLGRMMVRTNIVRMLVNRLRMEDLWRREPALRRRHLEPPVFVVGLQRTGTTLVHRLLAADPGFRFLASWEAINPAPLPRRWPGQTDPRVRTARLAELSLRFMAPDFFAIHPVEALAPEEDCLLFDYVFWSTVPEATLRVPSFSAWLETRPHHGAYRYYRDVLALLDWQRPGGRWLLKTPHHMEHLDELRQTFPGARLIQTHRDPGRALASFCSMVAHGRGVFSDAVDPHEVGRHWAAKTARMVQLAARSREQASDDAWALDIQYTDLVTDPLAQVRKIYDFLGRPLTATAEARMRAWLAANPQHKHGRHRYRLADFGLDPAAVARQFSAYRERYRVPAEPEERA